ncbi:GerMN domain-containing protein [Paenibacillus sp. FJAT-26967]|uniref:GerMN domain-containing protein n=1 Tax=Paenibacillus sp. FJAT-26967 TaxID=1729690 RepID=UPI0008390152|nr:GerMN domain-containing protein [Paenibacillus sp. FJAT-26967]
MRKHRWVQAAAVTGAIALVGTGCSLWTSETQPIDAPPAGIETSLGVSTGKEGAAAQTTQTAKMTVYAKDPQGYVVPVSLDLPKTQSVAKTTLEYMVAGGPGAGQLPAGFSALLPEGTTLTVDIKEKTATVNFNQAFKKYDAKEERKIMEGITWALTGFSTIDGVKLKMNGQELKEMPVARTPLDEPLSRKLGINLEIQQGIDYGQSTPVTLYFTNGTADKGKYYVPVTRLVKRTDDIARTVMEELVKGPNISKGLQPVLNASAKVLDVKSSSDSVMTVNFSDKLLDENLKAPADGLQSVILSLTENTKASQVQITVNGKAKVEATDDQTYSKPVARPLHLNPNPEKL